MRLIKPSFQIIEQSSGIEGVYKQIELVGRTCYKSEDKITEDSSRPFTDRMIKSQHYAMLEQGTVYLKIPYNLIHRFTHIGLCDKYIRNPYSRCNVGYEITEKALNFRSEFGSQVTEFLAVTTNLRVLIENGWEKDLQYLCEPTDYHERRVTVKFVCDRGVSHEFVRHRVFSFAQESTRYCNYSKDKFGNELTFIIPCWVDSLALQEIKGTVTSSDDFGSLITEYYYHLNGKEAPYFKTWEITPERNLLASLQIAEQLYLELLSQGWKPQEARAVLPNALKTELVMTGFVSDWQHFFDLRALGTTGAPHPQAKELAEPLMKEFERRGLLCTTQ